MTTQRTLLAATLLVAFVSVSAMGAGIVDSKHDFSGDGWARNQICLPCHAAHPVSKSSVNYKAGRLWNHALTQQTTNIKFDSYGASRWTIDPTGTNTVTPTAGKTDLDAGSILCMSCHDGTVALDNFGGGDNSGAKIASAYQKGAGGDLTGNHPVGSKGHYPTLDGKISGSSSFGDPERLGKAANGTTTLYRVSLQKILGAADPTTGVKATNYVVGCTSCHNPHNSLSAPYMLRVPQVGNVQVPGSSYKETGATDFASTIRPGPVMYEVPGSGLCLSCHIK
jgi:hypothetical protein